MAFRLRSALFVFMSLLVFILSCSANELNVKDFGAVGDGVSDDTDAIQLCIATSNGSVYFPTGTYLVSESIITDGRNMRGDGMTKSILLADSNDLDVLLPDQSTVSEMGIRGSGEEGTGSGIYLDSFGLCELCNLGIYSCATGIKIRNAWDITIYNCEIGHENERSNRIFDIDIDGSEPGDQPGQIRIIGTRLTSNNLSGAHLSIISAPPGVVLGCHIAYGVCQDAIYIKNTYGWHFIDVSAESVQYLLGGNNSQATMIGPKSGPNTQGMFSPAMGVNCNIIMLQGYEIGLHSGPNYSVALSAEDGYANAFTIKRTWGNCGDEQILSVSNSGSPDYEQNYQWGSGRAGSHIWYAGKTEALNLDRTGILNTGSIYPRTDDAYYLGKNDAAAPLAWKGLILRDKTNCKHYLIECVDGAITATQVEQ